MPLHSIDYLNARRNAKPASGGKRYMVKRNAADDRAQLASLDSWDAIQNDIAETLADLNRSIAALRGHASQFETMLPGESFDDLCF
jgi:hypothetical protein